MTLKLGMHHPVLKYYQVCSNDDPGLTLTYFTARSNLVPYAFIWGKGKTMDFSETIVVYDLKLRGVIDKFVSFFHRIIIYGQIYIIFCHYQQQSVIIQKKTLKCKLQQTCDVTMTLMT